jgi:hypothetical protein
MRLDKCRAKSRSSVHSIVPELASVLQPASRGSRRMWGWRGSCRKCDQRIRCQHHNILQIRINHLLVSCPVAATLKHIRATRSATSAIGLAALISNDVRPKLSPRTSVHSSTHSQLPQSAVVTRYATPTNPARARFAEVVEA